MTASSASYEVCAQAGQRSSYEPVHARRQRAETGHARTVPMAADTEHEGVSTHGADAAAVFSSRDLSCHCFSQTAGSGDEGSPSDTH